MTKISQVESELAAAVSLEHEIPAAVTMRRVRAKITAALARQATEYDLLLADACAAVDRCLARQARRDAYSATEHAWFRKAVNS